MTPATGTDPAESIAVPTRSGLGGHLQTHAKPLIIVAFASGLGIIASFAFHLVSARYLSPDDFGLLAAFFVIVNVAAIGSGSLQTAVAVQTAAAVSIASPSPQRLRDRLPTEAIVLGLAGGGAVAAISPWLAGALGTTPAVVIAAAVTIPFSFVFADAVGLLQGSGRVNHAVQWSTISQIARVVFAVIVVATATGLGGMIGAVLAALVFTVAGTLWTARGVARPTRGVFSVAGLTIMVLSIAFAWLTNSDTIFLRAGAEAHLAGTYASAAILVKTGFLIPTTLSLYLLPRFVRNRDNDKLARLGVVVTLALTLVTGVAMIGIFALLGDWMIIFLYGEDYRQAANFLVPASIAYLPWIAAQGMMIRMTSTASPAAAALLLCAVAAQWITFTATIPDVSAMLTAFGLIGAAVLVGFILLDIVGTRRAKRLRLSSAAE